MVLIGRKRSRVVFQRRGAGLDSYGAPVETWTPLHTCWASIIPLRGRDFLAAQQVQAEVTHRIFVNYNATTAGITPKDRVVLGTRNFDIEAILNVDELDRELELMAIERIGAP